MLSLMIDTASRWLSGQRCVQCCAHHSDHHPTLTFPDRQAGRGQGGGWTLQQTKGRKFIQPMTSSRYPQVYVGYQYVDQKLWLYATLHSFYIH